MNKVKKIVKIALLLCISFSLYAQEIEKIYLIDTPRCKVGVEKNNLKNIYFEGYCKIEKESTIVDTIKYNLQEDRKTRLDAYISSHNPKKDGKYYLYRIDDIKRLNGFSLIPKYKPLYLHGKKYMFISYRLNEDKSSVVLQAYDKDLLQKQIKFINTIPRDINITKVFTPATLRYTMAKVLRGKLYIKNIEKNYTQEDVTRLLYNEMSYEQMIQEYKDTKVFEALFTSQTFLQMISFDVKLKILQLLKKEIDSNYIFSLYLLLNHGYRFDNPKKEVQLQLKSIQYLTANYEQYKEYFHIDSKNERLSPLDMEAVVLINLYAKNKYHNEYKKALTKLYTLAQKDIKYYSIQILITVLSDDSLKVLHTRYMKFYEQKLKANKKEVFYLSVRNWKERTYIYIKIKLLAQETKKILKILKKDTSFLKTDSKFASTFTKDMSNKELVAKIAQKYGLKGVKFEVLDEDITIRGVSR